MKYILLFALLITANICYGQFGKYHQFMHYVSKTLNPPKSVRENCEWQYALVLVQTKQNHIVQYKLLNKVSDDLANSFKFLVNYQFPAALHINNRPVVFCVSIYNEKSKCADQIGYSPSEVLGTVLSHLSPQMEAHPNTLFITELAQMVYSTDPVH